MVARERLLAGIHPSARRQKWWCEGISILWKLVALGPFKAGNPCWCEGGAAANAPTTTNNLAILSDPYLYDKHRVGPRSTPLRLAYIATFTHRCCLAYKTCTASAICPHNRKRPFL